MSGRSLKIGRIEIVLLERSIKSWQQFLSRSVNEKTMSAISSITTIPSLVRRNTLRHSPDKKMRKRLQTTMEEYLTTAELSERIKMTPGTIRNLVWKNEFKENIHYLKPTQRKLLFIWSQVQGWLYRNSSQAYSKSSEKVTSLINI
jgi:hypothetical protein